MQQGVASTGMWVASLEGSETGRAKSRVSELEGFWMTLVLAIQRKTYTSFVYCEGMHQSGMVTLY